MPISLGSPGYPSHIGPHVISDKQPSVVMDSCTYGVCEGQPGYYKEKVDLDERSANISYGDVVETQTETLRGIDPPDPYRILIKIPGGMEYVNEAGEADVASAKKVKSTGAIKFDLENGHSSLAYVHHGNKVETAEYNPTVVGG